MNQVQKKHQELVSKLVKPGEAIVESLTPENAHLWHMASCVMSEAGELFDAIKKEVIYRESMDLDNVIEELGDIEFYLQGIRQQLNISRQKTLFDNIKKLRKRYDSGTYTDNHAQQRKDKN